MTLDHARTDDPPVQAGTPPASATAQATISILMPVYNEERHIETILRRVAAVPGAKQVIVIDDGSTDATAAILQKLSVELDFTAIAMPRNSGKGSAIRRGLEAVTGQVVIIQDGDLEYDPTDIPAVVGPILAGESEVVYGSRFAGNPEGMERRYYLGNRFFTVLANLLYRSKLSDVNTGYKAFETGLLRDLRLASRHFEFCAEVTAKVRRRGIVIREVPISYHARNVEEGKKLGIRDAWMHFWYFVKFRFVGR